MVKILLRQKKMERNAINTNGSTAMDVFLGSRKDVNDREIKRSLKRARGLPAKAVLKPRRREQQDRIKYYRKTLMVVATLIATMAFQVGINPPGGTWQDNGEVIIKRHHGHNDNRTAGHFIMADLNNSKINNSISNHDHPIGSHSMMADIKDNNSIDSNSTHYYHIAGHSILADLHTSAYERLMLFSSIALMSSLSVILLLISGLPCKRLFVVILVITMWIAITALALTYVSSIASLGVAAELLINDSLHPVNLLILYIKERKILYWTVAIVLYGWLFLIIMLLLTHVVRFIVMVIKSVVRLVVGLGKKLYRMCFPMPAPAIRLPV